MWRGMRGRKWKDEGRERSREEDEKGSAQKRNARNFMKSL